MQGGTVGNLRTPMKAGLYLGGPQDFGRDICRWPYLKQALCSKMNDLLIRHDVSICLQFAIFVSDSLFNLIIYSDWVITIDAIYN